tara:strand:- start:2125 stop:2574 length:450 start_codon:yes stop_codon:yes gene_type:complete
MKKIFLILSLIIVTSCGYQPIFSAKDANLNIEEIIFDSNDKISNKIKNKLNYLVSKENNNKVFKLLLKSERRILTSSKDSKGDTLIFKMIIDTEVEIYENEQILKMINISKDFSYKNNSNKFDLKQYEKIVEENLIDAIYQEIVLILYN